MLDEADAGAARHAAGARSTPTSPSSTRWSRRCCWPAGSTSPSTAARIATRSTCSRSPPRRRRASARTVEGAAGVSVDGDERLLRRAAAQPARERAPLRRRRDRSCSAARDARRRRVAAGLRPRPRRAGGDARAHLRAVLPPARPCRAGRRRRPRPGLVKQIAERHGGSVRCEARDGGGSCFVIDAAGGLSSSARAAAAAALARARVRSSTQAARPGRRRRRRGRASPSTQKPRAPRSHAGPMPPRSNAST